MIEHFLLTTARDRVVIPATLANPIESVTALQFPGAAVNVRLHFGGGEGHLVTLQGQTFEPGPEEAREGLFVSNAVGGGTLILDVSFITYREPLPVMDVTRARSNPGRPWVDQLLRNFGLKR